MINGRIPGRGALLTLLLLAAVAVSGCGQGESGAASRETGSQNKVAEAIQGQIAAEGGGNAQSTEDTPESVNVADLEPTVSVLEPSTQQSTPYDPLQDARSTMEGVDYDLTTMGGDMVFATVYELMNNPMDYVGKVFRIDGQYYAALYEPTQKNYTYCIIEDALGCCSQGLEFVWEDGQHAFPEEYPQDQAEILVTGTFEMYEDEVDHNTYCRLNHATMEVLKQPEASQENALNASQENTSNDSQENTVNASQENTSDASQENTLNSAG